ncbi:MAG: hypothetical protein LBJ39_06170 [Tannerellaceae bacterium]|jgi:hypothetical protein|nr:hypothetical protein [Tannerellaceae bacterium]
MTNKEKIDGLISDISELKGLVEGMREMEICTLAFFSQTFDLAYKIIRDLHVLEGLQIDAFQKQMEEYQEIIESTLILQKSMAEAGEQKVAAEPAPATPPSPAPSPAPTHTVDAMIAGKQTVSLNDALEKIKLSDFRKAFSLNDRFHFRQELFGGDEAKMNKAITDLNDIRSYEESVAYLNKSQNWDMKNAVVAGFLALLEKRFR